MTKTRLGFLVSHRGTNMQAVIDSCNSKQLQAMPVVVITNNPSCQALDRARRESIPNYIANAQYCGDYGFKGDEYILERLLKHRVELLVLAGYMKKIGTRIINAFAGRIVNIHPSLLPKYGGQGMYGSHVHEAVLAAGERETGATVHLVEKEYDQGPILAQKTVPVKENDTPSKLATRVLETEHKLLVETLDKIIRGEISTQLTRS